MTRDEVEEIGRRIDAGFASFRGEMAELRAEMAQQGKSLRAELRAEMAEQGKSLRAELRGEMAEQIGGLRSELRGEMAEQGKSLRAEIGDLRLEVGALRTEVARVADETHVNGLRIEAAHDQMRILADGIATANGKLHVLGRDVAIVAQRVEDVDLHIEHVTTEVRRSLASVRVDIVRLEERQQQLEDGRA